MSSSSTTSSTTLAIATLQSLLGSTLFVTTNSSRTFKGSFVCVDSDTNLVLQHAVELVQEEGSNDGEERDGSRLRMERFNSAMERTRMYGLVLIPGHKILDVHIEKQVQQLNQGSTNKRNLQAPVYAQLIL